MTDQSSFVKIIDKMNYFYYMHGTLLFFIKFFITILCLTGVFFGVLEVSRLLKLPENKINYILFPAVLIVLYGSMTAFSKIIDPFHDGGLKRIYIFETNGKPCLSTWLTRYHFKRFGAVHDQRLKTFELETGKPMGMVQMVKKHYSDEYRLYWSGGDKAWGYSRETGIQLLDMLEPQILAEEQEILKQNPELGGRIKLYPWGNAYDPQQHTLYVIAADGQYYRLDYQLKAMSVKEVSFNDSFVKKSLNFTEKWQFYPLRESLGVHLHARGDRCSPESMILLEPEFIPEQNTFAHRKNKIWVTCKSTLSEDSDLLLSYIKGNGQKISDFNLTKMFDVKYIKVLSTLTRSKDIFIFIGVGAAIRTNVDGFALYALKVDKGSGELIKEIHYF